MAEEQIPCKQCGDKSLNEFCSMTCYLDFHTGKRQRRFVQAADKKREGA